MSSDSDKVKADILKCLGESRRSLMISLQALARQQEEDLTKKLAEILKRLDEGRLPQWFSSHTSDLSRSIHDTKEGVAGPPASNVAHFPMTLNFGGAAAAPPAAPEGDWTVPQEAGLSVPAGEGMRTRTKSVDELRPPVLDTTSTKRASSKGGRSRQHTPSTPAELAEQDTPGVTSSRFTSEAQPGFDSEAQPDELSPASRRNCRSSTVKSMHSVQSVQSALESNFSEADPDSPSKGLASLPDISPLVRAVKCQRSRKSPQRSTKSNSSGRRSAKQSDGGSSNHSGDVGNKLDQPWPVWRPVDVDSMLDHERFESADGAGLLGDTEMKMGLSSITQQGTKRGSMKTGDTIEDSGFMQKFMSRPNSMRKTAWDLTACLFLMYDLMTIPMSVFEIKETGFSLGMAKVTLAFWTVDILQTFTTGYHDGGVVEMRPKKIAWHYLRTWFSLDLMIVSADWAYEVLKSAGGDLGWLRIGKSVRFFRVLRFIRLLRVWKVLKTINEWTDVVPQRSISTALTIAKMVLGIAWISHFVACCWYALGEEWRFEYEGYQSSWVDGLRERGDHTVAYAYTSALHWSLTQFTPASMEVVPRNAVERGFNCVVIIVAMVIFSSLIGTITQGMNDLRRQNQLRNQEREQLRTYLYDRQVSLELGNRVRSFLTKYQQDNKTYVHEEDVSFFQALPEIIRVELHSEVFNPLLIPHPFFHHYLQGDDMGMVNICHYMMQEKSMHSGKELFLPGEECNCMYFLVHGNCSYFHDSDPDASGMVSPGSHFCEMVLWLPWKHVGRLVATINSELVMLNATMFLSMMSQMKLARNCRVYAQMYVAKLKAIEEGNKSLEKSLSKIGLNLVADALDEAIGGTERVTDIFFDFDMVQEIAQEAFSNVAHGGRRRKSGSMLEDFLRKTTNLSAEGSSEKKPSSFMSWNG